MAKEKKVEVREVERGNLAQLIMEDKGLEAVKRIREGLVIETLNDEGQRVDLVVKVIQKKALVANADVVEVIVKEEVTEPELEEGAEIVEVA